MLPRFNRGAHRFAEEHNLAGTVGSDAHTAFELGRSLLVLEPFEGPEGMRKVIRAGSKSAVVAPLVPFLSRYASIYKKVTNALNAIDTT